MAVLVSFSFCPICLFFHQQFALKIIGYDVWMGNTRGNTYSRNHTYLDTCSSCPEFWSFGFDDSGNKDYTAEIDYILAQTGQEKVHFVGHSMGTTQLMVLYILFIKTHFIRTTQTHLFLHKICTNLPHILIHVCN